MAEGPLQAQGERQGREPAESAGRHEPLGEPERQRQIRHQAIERLMARMDRLESAEGERDRGHRGAPGEDVEASGIEVRGGDEGQVMEPHREPVGGRDVEDAVEDQVRGIERGDVALGDERDAQPEPALQNGSRPCSSARASSLLSGRYIRSGSPPTGS